MDLKAVLAANIRRLVDAESARRGVPVSIRAWALGKGLNVRMIDRLAKGQHAVTLDTLDKVATACKLKPWHLLLEEFDASGTLPDAPLSDQERQLLRRLRRILDE